MANAKKRCRHCKKYELVEKGFAVPLGFFCSSDCRNQHGIKNTKSVIKESAKLSAKDARKAVLEFRLGDTSFRKKAAQSAFNAFIRKRDEGQPCISCGTMTAGQYHAGHYLSVGAHPQQRFDELNVHIQCSVCNNFRSGNVAEYRKALIKKIGIEQVEALESNHELPRLRAEDYLKIEQEYKLKFKALASK